MAGAGRAGKVGVPNLGTPYCALGPRCRMITCNKRRGLSFVPALPDRSKTISRHLCWRPLLPFPAQRVLRHGQDEFRGSAGLLAHGVSRKSACNRRFWRHWWRMVV